MKIEDFCGDFTDGVQFCNLLEIISSKKLPKWNAKPRMKPQKLENVSFGLQFLKKEGIKLVAIGPEDVVEPKLKLILGLIWTIILRYQIQRGEDDGGSARSELLKWVRSKIPEYDIKVALGCCWPCLSWLATDNWPSQEFPEGLAVGQGHLRAG